MRIGLFLSRDDGRVSRTVDVDALAKEYAHLAATKVYDNFFRQGDQEDILKTVAEKGLDAVVLAGNSPKYFDRVLGGNLILDALKNQGVNENKIAFANIREQVALPHSGENGKAMEKARLLIDVAIAKVGSSPSIESITVSPRRAVLVAGATAGGILAARELLAKGYRVYLVDRAPSMRAQPEMAEEILPTVTAVLSNPKAVLLFGTDINDVSGYCGQYTVALSTPGGSQEVRVGGIILSVGDDVDWISALRSKLRFNTDRDGFPEQEGGLLGQTGDPGVWFISNKAQGDSFSAEMSGASVAVLSLSTILDASEIAHPLLITAVNENVCGGCGTCVKTCAFSASSIDLTRKLSVINPERCKGCGNCVTACPTGARDLVSFPRNYVAKAIDILSHGAISGADPKILAVFCKNCGHLALDAAGGPSNQEASAKYSPSVMPLLVECGGNVDTQYVLQAFSKGFDGVALFVCRDGHCHNIVGNTDMQRRLGLFRAVLRSRDIDDDRLRVVPVYPNDGDVVIEEMNSFVDELKSMR